MKSYIKIKLKPDGTTDDGNVSQNTQMWEVSFKVGETLPTERLLFFDLFPKLDIHCWLYFRHPHKKIKAHQISKGQTRVIRSKKSILFLCIILLHMRITFMGRDVLPKVPLLGTRTNTPQLFSLVKETMLWIGSFTLPPGNLTHSRTTSKLASPFHDCTQTTLTKPKPHWQN